MWGTVLAALAQGLAIAAGFFVIDLFAHTGMGRWALLLGVLSAVVAVIPFIGTAAVWVPTAIVLFLQGHTVASIAVVVYGLAVVGTIDNLIKIIVIKDAANLHPLLVLVCAFGGLQVMGILGIFLGPAVGAIVFALMQTLRNELNSLTAAQPATIPPG
jgi:predicted PurR-regulated permease PerM